MVAEFTESQGEGDWVVTEFVCMHWEMASMTASRDRLVVRGDKVVRGVPEVVLLFYDEKKEFLKQLVSGVKYFVAHGDPDHSRVVDWDHDGCCKIGGGIGGTALM